VIFHGVNGGRGTSWSPIVWNYHESNLQLRARSGGVWIVTADNCSPESIKCSAPSGVVDGQGLWACRAPTQGAHILSHVINA